MRFTGAVFGVARTVLVLDSSYDASVQAAVLGIRQAATEGVEVVKRNASGSPGPEVRSNEYRSSWSTDFNIEPPTTIEGQIFTQKPQGQRLENGFFGIDSLGRVVQQFPRPHVRPAEPEIRDIAVTLIRNYVKAGVG